MPSEPDLLTRKLLKWYASSARDLPWRRTKDPYAIWVSEIMLQQTQVQTVVAYYRKWLEKFPTVQDLARADLQDVLSVWAGLGYYRRARMIHQAAKEITEKYSGSLPGTAEALMKLPGIGRYTAGAIASIAFGRRSPVLDGNVIRILTRIYAIKEDVSERTTLKRLWTLAEDLLPKKNPGDLNQALMELGATVCFPRNPDCGQCPAAFACAAKAEGRQPEYPVKKNRERYEKVETFAVVRHADGKMLLRRQPEYGRWGGLWMFPFWPSKEALLQSCGLSEAELEPLGSVEHGFTKYRVTLRAFEWENSETSVKPSAAEGSEDRWIKFEDLADFAMPAPHRKIAVEFMRKYAESALS